MPEPRTSPAAKKFCATALPRRSDPDTLLSMETSTTTTASSRTGLAAVARELARAVLVVAIAAAPAIILGAGDPAGVEVLQTATLGIRG
jgi:hypothetical protein